MNKRIFFALVFMPLLSMIAVGDWISTDGHKMHYPQLPNPNGWDVCLGPMTIADDFQCSQTGPITEIHFWISWKNNLRDNVTDWYVAIYEDINGTPGQPLWKLEKAQIQLLDQEGDLQGWLCPCYPDPALWFLPDNHTTASQVNITEIENPFKQELGKRYWLVLHLFCPYAESNAIQAEAGWKTAFQHYAKSALWTPWPISPNPVWKPIPSMTALFPDMAFVINGRDIPAQLMDFGDADETKCDSTGTKCNTYPTTLVRDGARHGIVPGVFMGSPILTVIQIDPEADGQPTLLCDGDDINGIDDEQAVKLPAVLIPGTVAMVEISVSVDGFIDAWIDFNADGDWDDLGERIFYSAPVVTDLNTLSFLVPFSDADYAPRDTYSRFRFSTAGGLNYYGPARDGEVEDYLVKIDAASQPGLDFGDTPDGDFAPSGYPTILLTNGARHKINPQVRLGRSIDGEPDGQTSMGADGDDLNDLDDEDGVVFAGPLTPGQNAEIKVVASCDGLLYGWVDFNADNDWDDLGEQIFQAKGLAAGVNPLTFYVSPLSTQIEPFPTYVRFRLTSLNAPEKVLGYAGLAEDGEVEDYLVKIVPEPRWDFGDAPELRCDDATVVRCNSYPTTLARDGARHCIDPAVFLGNPRLDCGGAADCIQIDAEKDGQPTLAADGDDINGDDEGGVEFLSPLIPGMPAKTRVWVSVDGCLDAWIDFNNDGDWDDFAEQIFACEKLTMGANELMIHVPPHPHAIPTNAPTYARFRFSLDGGLKYSGPARNGEVEDYLVKIEPPQRIADLGDAPDSTNHFNVNMTAYRSLGPLDVIVPAKFPTVFGGLPPYGPIHWNPIFVAYLGQAITRETDADYGYDEDPTNNLIPPKDAPDMDKADDGVRIPLRLPHRRPARFDYLVHVLQPIDKLYVNVWLDWNRDGDWDDTIPCGNPDDAADKTLLAHEWAVRNQMLTDLKAGFHRIATPPFICWHPFYPLFECPIWMRITLSEKPWMPTTPMTDILSAPTIEGYGGSGPDNGYWIGETEDYIFVPLMQTVDSADLNNDGRVDLEDFNIFASQWMLELPQE
ncbi:MAG: GEVED domain-containing protein [Anaerohalosphaeraceae bacterium]